jgi:hypothetical protein
VGIPGFDGLGLHRRSVVVVPPADPNKRVVEEWVFVDLETGYQKVLQWSVDGTNGVPDDDPSIDDTMQGGLKSTIAWVLSKMKDPPALPEIKTVVPITAADGTPDWAWSLNGTIPSVDAAFTDEMLPGLRSLIRWGRKAGPRGETGERGPQGDPGDRGPRGFRGFQGGNGDGAGGGGGFGWPGIGVAIGAVGGNTVTRIYPGTPGAQGPIGIQGIQGRLGVAGLVGDGITLLQKTVKPQHTNVAIAAQAEGITLLTKTIRPQHTHVAIAAQAEGITLLTKK